MRNVALLYVLLVFGCKVHAQENLFSLFPSTEYDTSYIKSYYDKLIGNLYIPAKFVNFGVHSVDNNAFLNYEPNGRS
ncbi:MAG: hypothetical protein PHU27_11505, partial [Salinivirgaceae bacterium]|nr:hypothetical protein [Salinivirgaceae bacterium]